MAAMCDQGALQKCLLCGASKSTMIGILYIMCAESLHSLYKFNGFSIINMNTGAACTPAKFQSFAIRPTCPG